MNISGSLYAHDDIETLERLDALFERVTFATPEPYDPSRVDEIREQGGEVLVEIDRFDQRWRALQWQDGFSRCPLEPLPEWQVFRALGHQAIGENQGCYHFYWEPSSGRIALDHDRGEFWFLDMSLVQAFVCHYLSELSVGMANTEDHWLLDFTLPGSMLCGPEWVKLWDCPFYACGPSKHYLHESQQILVSHTGAFTGSSISLRDDIEPDLRGWVLGHVVDAHRPEYFELPNRLDRIYVGGATSPMPSLADYTIDPIPF